MALASFSDEINNTTPQEPYVPDIPPDDFNLYGDLHNADLGETVTKLQNHNEELTNHITRLNKDIEKLCGELMRMKGNEEKLKRNISELFNTAKTEIARKDRMIADLRKQSDDLLFRRRTYVPNGKSGEEVNSNVKKRSLVEERSEASAQKRPKYERVDELLLKCNVAHLRSSDDRSSRSYSKSPKRQERSRSGSKYDNRPHRRSPSRSRHRNESRKEQVSNTRKDRRHSPDFNSRHSRHRLDNRFEFREKTAFKRGSTSGKNSNSVITRKDTSKRNEYLSNSKNNHISSKPHASKHVRQEEKLKNDGFIRSKSQIRENCEKLKIKEEIMVSPNDSMDKHSGSGHGNSEYMNNAKTKIKQENLLDDYFKRQHENFELQKHKNTKQEVSEDMIHNNTVDQVPSKMNRSKIPTETVNSSPIKKMEAKPSPIANNSKETVGQCKEVKQEVINASEKDVNHITNFYKETIEQLTDGSVQKFNPSEVTKLHSENGLVSEEKQNDVSMNTNLRKRRRCVITIVG